MSTTAIILAAGRGSRLYPYTEDCPKCLTVLAGMTLLERQIATLRSAGIDDIVIVSGYLGHMLNVPGTRRVENPDWACTNMVESLFAAEDQFGDDVIVAYGDIVYELGVVETLQQSPHGISVCVDKNWRAYWAQRFDDPLSDAESLRLDDQGRIIDIGNKAAHIDDIQGQYIGLMRFSRGGVEVLRRTRAALGDIPRPWMKKRNVANAYMTDLLMEMILTGNDLHASFIDGRWVEIDTASDLDLAKTLVTETGGGLLRIRAGA